MSYTYSIVITSNIYTTETWNGSNKKLNVLKLI